MNSCEKRPLKLKSIPQSIWIQSTVMSLFLVHHGQHKVLVALVVNCSIGYVYIVNYLSRFFLILGCIYLVLFQATTLNKK